MPDWIGKAANITGLSFEPWGADAIRSFSVVEITNAKLYDNQEPSEGGLRDVRMGITSRKGHCTTCMQTWKYCPGHFGHLELAIPVYHAGWVHLIIKALKSVCLNCFEKLDRAYGQRKKLCTMCGKTHITVQKNEQWYIQLNGKPLLPCDAIKYLEKIKGHDASHAILNVLPIPPNCVRPSPTIGGDEIRGEDDLTRTLLRIVRINSTVSKHLKVVKTPEAIKNILKKLQEVVSGYIYRSKNNKGKNKINSKVCTVADRIRHKNGRIRGNGMGKRVNFTARGVVGPDSKMGMHEVGVPQCVADTLTITENIHAFNVDYWQKIINTISGTDPKCPVKFVVRADGKRLDLRFNKPKLSIGYKVERKLQNGDIALFNRQPSLHKMSIMAHYVRIMPGEIFRLNLSCTTPYNADFDGDEMNFHALQTIEARAEAENIMAVKHNIITPQSHRPVMSLVMDGFLGTAEISMQDSFLDKSELFDWMMETGTMGIPIPAICHPAPLWTGKQALSMIMPKKLRYKVAKPVIDEELNEVCIKDGQVLYGKFGKKILGRSQGSLVHILWLDFGPDVCINFLNKLQRGIHRWFSEQGFSIGIYDFLATKETQKEIEKEYQRTLHDIKSLTKEHEINHRLNQARDGMGRAAINTIKRDNRLFRMVSCGVKGSMMNILQIMAMVGQQNSGGRRIVRTIAGKTLPCFKATDTSPESLGMVRSPYMAGLTPYEFFFTGIVGRDGLINTAINTAVTGYIQRRLVKAMETCKTQWDGSVRDANGVIVQFKYGEDGFDGQSLEMNNVSITNMNKKQLMEIYDWNNDEEYALVQRAKQIIRTTNLRQVSSCFNVRRQVDRATNHREASQCMPHEAYAVLKPCFDWFMERNILVFAIVIQTCSAKRLSCEFKLTVEEITNLMEKFKNKYERTLIPAGEMVGTLAAQSLGEPVTQMTLDTFHHAGISTKNVSLGVPRFEELINASSTPKTPTCSVILNGTSAAEMDKAVEISFKVVHLIVRNVVSDSSIELINFAGAHPTYYLLPDTPLKRLNHDGNWCVKLCIPYKKLIQYQVEFPEIIKALEKKFSKGINMAYTENPFGDTIIHIGNYGKKNNKNAAAVLRNRIMNCYIRGINNIEVAQPCLDDGVLSIETVGTNIYELYKLKNDYTCIKSVLSNHPFDVLEKFGIEAARQTLYKQIHMVLSFDGSYVSCRHYLCAVDRMTLSGNITAMTRHGIAKYENKSPLARATFEQPVEVLLAAASKRKMDPMSGVSEQILMGITPRIGTAEISLHKTEHYKNIINAAAEEESEDEDEGWLQFDNTESKNFNFAVAPATQMGGWSTIQKPQAPPMLFPPTVPMWAQKQHTQTFPVQNTPWGDNVVAAVGVPNQPSYAQPFHSHITPMFNAPPSMFGGGFNQDRQQFVAPPRPMSPEYNPNRPLSPVYDPNKPMSPEYNPNRPLSPVYDPNKPMSPEYNPNMSYTVPMSPASPEYDPINEQGHVTPPYSPTSPGYESPNSPDYDNADVYDPNKTY